MKLLLSGRVDEAPGILLLSNDKDEYGISEVNERRNSSMCSPPPVIGVCWESNFVKACDFLRIDAVRSSKYGLNFKLDELYSDEKLEKKNMKFLLVT